MSQSFPAPIQCGCHWLCQCRPLPSATAVAPGSGNGLIAGAEKNSPPLRWLGHGLRGGRWPGPCIERDGERCYRDARTAACSRTGGTVGGPCQSPPYPGDASRIANRSPQTSLVLSGTRQSGGRFAGGKRFSFPRQASRLPVLFSRSGETPAPRTDELAENQTSPDQRQ
jgi:hypothetical protein